MVIIVHGIVQIFASNVQNKVCIVLLIWIDIFAVDPGIFAGLKTN